MKGQGGRHRGSWGDLKKELAGGERKERRLEPNRSLGCGDTFGEKGLWCRMMGPSCSQTVKGERIKKLNTVQSVLRRGNKR